MSASEESKKTKVIVCADPWAQLATMTSARIALGRAGCSMPLRANLALQLDHARARDAVHTPLRVEKLVAILQDHGLRCLSLTTQARGRNEYLTRPDKGRQLDDQSLSQLHVIKPGFDVCLVLADGLSARAVHEQGAGFVVAAADMLQHAGFSCGPVCVVENGRVAIGDVIGHALGARLVAVLIGERPGLSSPNSLGLYLTMNPMPGMTDECRNCISNIREGGLGLQDAVRKFGYLVENALQLGCTGIALKDRMTPDYQPFGLPFACPPKSLPV